MKIASIVCTYPPYAGGIGNSAHQINQLLGEKHEITVFNPNTNKAWLKYGHGAFLPQLLWKLNKFDYLYLHYPFFGTAEVVWFFKLFFSRPKLIIHYHMDVKNSGFLTSFLSLPSRLIRHYLLEQAEIIVSASFDYIKHSQIKYYYESHQSKFCEIPFGVDTEIFQPKLINRPLTNKIIARAQEIVHYVNDKFIKRNRLNLLFVGGLDRAHYFKGLEILLESLTLLSNKNWHLRIVGEGELRTNYEKLSSDLKLKHQIDFAGKLNQTELIRSFQEADLFILPSINKNEAFGLVLIEALACGVPVIASSLPGVRKVFEDNKQGLLTKPGDAKDLKSKLEFIFKNETKRRLMAKEARYLAEKKYTLNRMKINLENLFN